MTLTVACPFTRSKLTGTVAPGSVVVKVTEPVKLMSVFQLSSTARTWTSKASPATCVRGVPVFPSCVPAAADSPGINSCRRTAGPEDGSVGVGVPVAVSVAGGVEVAVSVSVEPGVALGVAVGDRAS